MALPQVVVPVFNALQALQACLESIARHSPGAGVLVIDDASTEPEIAPLLEAWVKETPSRRLITHAVNQGFVRTANEGLRQSVGDVVLLNSDTVVTPQWLERLTRCLASDSSIATATPWSNNGEIVSFPEFCKAAAVPPDPDALAVAIAAAGEPVYPDIPTAVGFCMAISRHALDAVGYFDEQAFGRGYGEENDFCLRATAAGMRHVLCDDAYVAHHGGASFAPLGLAPGEATMQALLQKHPAYQDMISDFIRRDPLAQRRKALIAGLRSAAVPAVEFPGETRGD